MARLVINDGSTSRTIDLTDAVTVAGRAPENKVVIDDKQASRRHFSIDRIEFGFKLVDLESRNGTRVNDRQVNQLLLRPGDRIQIGHHTLTFEDPNFREPPADVAARLSPSSAAAPAPVDAPPPPSDRPAALPVAVEVGPKPVASAPPPTPPPAPEPPSGTRRNRSGHTTAVQKNLQHQLHEEQKTLTMVAVGAGVFIFVIIILIFVGGGSSGEAPAVPRPPAAKPGPSLADQERMDREQHDFEELSNFYDRNRNAAASYAEIIKRVDEFEKTYPRSPNGMKAREFRAAALNGQKTSRNADFTQAEHGIQEDLKKEDFGGALTKIRELLAKYKTDADIYERLAKLKGEVIDEAKTYFRNKAQEADAMKFSRKDEARDAYRSLLKTMGSGLVPELDDYCRICRLSLEGLQ